MDRWNGAEKFFARNVIVNSGTWLWLTSAGCPCIGTPDLTSFLLQILTHVYIKLVSQKIISKEKLMEAQMINKWGLQQLTKGWTK